MKTGATKLAAFAHPQRSTTPKGCPPRKSDDSMKPPPCALRTLDATGRASIVQLLKMSDRPCASVTHRVASSRFERANGQVLSPEADLRRQSSRLFAASAPLHRTRFTIVPAPLQFVGIEAARSLTVQSPYFTIVAGKSGSVRVGVMRISAMAMVLRPVARARDGGMECDRARPKLFDSGEKRKCLSNGHAPSAC